MTRGLLGLAFHHHTGQRPLFVFYSAPCEARAGRWNCTSHLSEFKVMQGNPQGRSSSERIVSSHKPGKSQCRHNCFGRMATLYPLAMAAVPTMSAGHTRHGQRTDITKLLGRSSALTSTRLSLRRPADNPSSEGRADEIYAIGFRNPFRSLRHGRKHEILSETSVSPVEE